MHQLVVKVVERAYRYPVVKRHLISNLQKVDTLHTGIEVQIDNRMLHPAEPVAAPFQPVTDTAGYRIKRLHDFLDARGWRTRAVRTRNT
jgi:hypothetical protein